MRSKPTVALVLDTSSKEQQKPLKLRVTYERIPHLYSVNSDKTLTTEQFANDKLKVTKDAKEEASKAVTVAKAVIDELGQDFTFPAFRKRYKERLFGKKKDTTTFVAIGEEYLANHTLEDKTISIYKTAINWINRYKPITKTKDIDQDYVKGLIAYIKKTHKDERDKDVSENTIRIYLRSYRAIYNYAIDEGKVSGGNPFSNIQGQSLSSIGREKDALTEEELKTLIDYEPTNAKEHKGRDFFILTLQLCGTNLGDILSFKNKNISGDTISFIRRKTRRSGIVTTLDLTEVAVALLNKYGRINADRPDDYILPYLTNVTTEKAINNKIHDVLSDVNEGLESICNATGMDKFTTYNARHTYASRAQSSGMTAEQIQKFLGHTTSRTTQTYLHSITKSVREKNKGVLDDMMK